LKRKVKRKKHHLEEKTFIRGTMNPSVPRQAMQKEKESLGKGREKSVPGYLDQRWNKNTPVEEGLGGKNVKARAHWWGEGKQLVSKTKQKKRRGNHKSNGEE